MDYKKTLRERHTSRCLECGESIRYGRADKKFCCEECKNRHHRNSERGARVSYRKVLSVLRRNYDILDAVVRSGEDALWLSEAVAMGFTPGYATWFSRQGRKELYHCFDISYISTPNRLSSISKIRNLSLSLQAVGKE